MCVSVWLNFWILFVPKREDTTTTQPLMHCAGFKSLDWGRVLFCCYCGRGHELFSAWVITSANKVLFAVQSSVCLFAGLLVCLAMDSADSNEIWWSEATAQGRKWFVLSFVVIYHALCFHSAVTSEIVCEEKVCILSVGNTRLTWLIKLKGKTIVWRF